MNASHKTGSLFISILALTLVVHQTGFTQIDTTLKEFYPLHLGDLWQYRDQDNTLYTYQVAIEDTLLPNARHYAAVGVPPIFLSGYDFQRVDSLYRVVKYGGPPTDSCGGAPYEYSIYRLNQPSGTSWPICQNIVITLCRPWFIRFEGISAVTVFGQQREVMRFTPGAICSPGDTVWYFVDWLLVRGIGIYREETIENTYRYLTGAIVNGVLYGTVVSVEGFASTTPSRFMLAQNYPNPYNAITDIDYDLPSESQVSLKVYDLLGREIATLLDRHQIAGHYQQKFDASNVASGVYLYTLSTGKYSQTRLMVVSK